MVSVYRHLPAVADILFGKCTTQVKGTDQINAIISSLLSCIAKRGAEVTGRELENVCRYASRFLADFSSLFFRRMMKIEGMNLKLVKIF